MSFYEMMRKVYSSAGGGMNACWKTVAIRRTLFRFTERIK
ncbi:hypothetical protein B4080_5485 [Bacillus cereus]|nr:hypothetical protein B4080_5485 [Bacillus cereus]